MKASKAVGKVRLAMERVASEMPLHAGLMTRWQITSDSVTTPTMSIAFRLGRFHLCVNPNFVEPLTLDMTAGVVVHEIGHAILGHVFLEQYENRAAMTIAEETVVNDWVPFPLPGEPVVTSDYPMLSPSDDTFERYEILKGIIPDTQVLAVVDDHEAWEKIRRNGDLAKLTATMDIATVWSTLTLEQRANVRMPQAVQKRLKASGVLDGVCEDVSGATKASVDWRKVLRRYVGRETKKRPVFGKPPRRFPELVGIVPGKARQTGKPKVMAVIDTSSSITPALLSAISTELALMSRTYKVTVVECDDAIRAVYPYEPIERVRHRGGTDLRPPFEPDFIKEQKPDLVVYFTDGCGPAPDSPPRIPVIWALTPSGRMPCSWGRELKMG